MKKKHLLIIIIASLATIIGFITIKNHNKKQSRFFPVYAAIDGYILIDGPAFFIDGYNLVERPKHFDRDIASNDQDLILYEKENLYLYIKIKKFNVKSGDKVKKNELLGYVEKKQEVHPAVFKECKENCEPE